MPEFILNKPRASRFDSLSEFEQGYIEAMFFTNGDCGDEREHLLNDMGTSRLTKASLAAIRKDCRAFLSHIMPDGCFVRQWLDRVDDYSDEQAGHDLWFTRQGHGVGYWSRDELEGDAQELWRSLGNPRVGQPGWDEYATARESSIGNALTAATKVMGESYVEVWRGWIHVR